MDLNWSVIFSAIAAIGAIFAAMAGLVQAGHTANALALSRDTAIRQLRAYVGVFDVIGDISDSNTPRISVFVKNAGQTPALRVEETIFVTYWSAMPTVMSDKPFTPVGSMGSIGPGQIMKFSVASDPLTQTTRDLLDGGTCVIYLEGVVRYWDIFGVLRSTQYQMYCKDISVRSKLSFVFDSIGNEEV